MSESLGLSIGVANLVAARVGSAPITRRSVLTLFDNRPSEVGLPEQNPNLTEPGLVLRGFIERIGDRTPLVAADGTNYLGEALTVEALEAMARTAGYGTPVAIAVPAYWSEGQFRALREEFFAQPGLASGGVPPALISDATAALAALYAKPGFPTDGVVALCDFGASGTSVTLANARSNFQQVGPSVRNTDFSGDAIDQLILNHLRAGGLDAGPTSTDVGGTASMGSFTRLLSVCQRAKEQLSTATVTTIPTGSGGDIRLSRNEFDQLIAEPLDRFVAAVEGILQRNGVPRANLAAVATVGGGASIPLLHTRLSQRLQAPIFTTPQPAFSAAIGASVLGQQQSSAAAATAAGPVVDAPTDLVGSPPTKLAPTVSTVQAGDDDRSAGDQVLAWSEDAATGGEPVPYTGPEHTGEYARATTGSDDEDANLPPAEPGPLPWYKRTALVVSVAAAGAAVLLAVVLALTMGHTKTSPVNTTTPTEPAPPQTVTITGSNDSPTVTVIPAPPPTQAPATTTANQPATTTTTQPPTTTTTQPPTTTSSQVTTTAPPTSSQQTTTAAPVTPTRHPFEPPFGR
jgi:Hsp70 protein